MFLSLLYLVKGRVRELRIGSWVDCSGWEKVEGRSSLCIG